MSVDTKSDYELLKMLEQTSQLFHNMGFPNSSQILNNISRYISGKIPNSLDENYITAEFNKFQNLTHTEFSTTSHKSNCSSFLLTAFRKSIKNHHDKLVEIINNNSRIDKQEKRYRSYRNLQLLKKIVMNGATNDEEKLIGISYAYLSLVDGIFTTSLLECYVWDRISRNLPVNIESVYKMSITDVYKYFRNQSLPLHYFDGWDVKVRNAVAHSSFKFDSTRNKMVYEARKGTSEYNINEMIENYEKLESTYPLILSVISTTVVNDIFNEFIHRY